MERCIGWKIARNSIIKRDLTYVNREWQNSVKCHLPQRKWRAYFTLDSPRPLRTARRFLTLFWKWQFFFGYADRVDARIVARGWAVAALIKCVSWIANVRRSSPELHGDWPSLKRTAIRMGIWAAAQIQTIRKAANAPVKSAREPLALWRVCRKNTEVSQAVNAKALDHWIVPRSGRISTDKRRRVLESTRMFCRRPRRSDGHGHTLPVNS
jgi:hypothetical protein